LIARNFIGSRYWWPFVLLLIVSAVAWTWASRVPDAAYAERMPSPREGFPAPDFNLQTLTGDQIQLSALQGKVVIVSLWASWCVPCRAEMPALQKIYLANHERGLEILAVNSTVQDSVADAQKFVDNLGLTFPVGLDIDGSVSRRYLLQALPSTFIVDQRGVIQSVLIGGPVSEAVLQSKVDALLEAAP
jgi:peroxiredoxin